MRKTKLLLVAFLAMLGSSVSAAEYEIDEKLTSVAALDGKLFAIVDETDLKAFCFGYGENGWDMFYKAYNDGDAQSAKACYFKLSAASGDGADGYYYLQAYSASGTIHEQSWARGGYFNSQPTDGPGKGCCFDLGLSDKNGQDLKNGAVWDLVVNEDGKFALKNIGTGKYLSKNINEGDGKVFAAGYDDPTYFTFCTLKESEASVVEGLKAKYNEKKAQILAINSDIDVSAADALAESATTEEAIDEAIASLLSAFEDYLANAGSEVNVTSIYVVNPSFETGNTNGWTYESSNDSGAKENSNGTYTISNADGKYVFNIWSSGNLISQTIEGLPNGNYKLMALIATDAGNKVQLSANGETVQVDASSEGKGVGVDGTVEFAVLERKATIGAEGVNKYWYKVDNFRLFYTGAIVDLTPYQEALAKAVEEAQKIGEGTIPSSVYSALQTTISENDIEWSSADDYTTATNAIIEATAEAKKLITPYANFQTLKAIAEDLASAGTDNTTGQSALSSAISTQSDNVEGAEAADDINSAYTTLKEEMTDYANNSNPVGEGEKFNLTFMLTNPDLTGLGNGPKSGWYNDQTQPTQNSQAMTTNGSVANSADKSKFAMYEYWSNATEPTEGYVVYQKVTLPEGTYRMTALAFAGFGGGHRYGYQTDGDHSLGSLGEGDPNITFSAGDTDGTSINTPTLEPASIEFVQSTEGEVKIGLKAHENNRSNWMGIGYVELFKVPENTIELDEEEAYEPADVAGNVTLKKTIYSGWNTIALPFGVTADDVTAQFGAGQLYKYTGDDEEGVLNFEEAEAIAPHTPYLFNSTTGDGSQIEMSFEGVTVSSGNAKAAGTSFDFVGTYEPITSITANDYVLGESAFVKAKGGNALKAFRAYIQGKEESAARELLISIDGEVTAIETIDGKKVNSNAAIYNLAGQKVKKAQKGIFIQDGKKVIVK